MNSAPRVREPAVIDLIEEAAHVLRTALWATWMSHLIGGVPFVLAALFYIGDMSRGADADQHCLTGALGLTGFYLWLKIWQTRFATQLQAQIMRQPAPEWDLRRWCKVALVQAVIQPTELVFLTLAAATLVPFAWVYPFYQGTVLLGDGQMGVRATVRRAATLAAAWPRQSFSLLMVLGLLGMVIFMNVMIFLMQAPQVLKMLLGIDSEFVHGGETMNSTFVAIAVGLTWLIVSPLCRTVYVLRGFYALSRETGDDLKLELRGSHSVAVPMIAFFLVFAGLTAPLTAETVEAPAAPVVTPAVPPEQLNRSIEHVLERKEFTWRLPREKPVKTEAEQDGWLMKALKDFRISVGKIFKTISKWYDSVSNALHDLWKKLFGRRSEPSSQSGANVNWMEPLRWLALLLLAVVAVTAGVFGWRAWRRRSRGLEVLGEAVAVVPDLRDESVMADQLPEDGWLRLAAELLQKGESRLALRALYLAGLAHLGQQGLVSIARHKSNHDYTVELGRRAKSRAEVVQAFGENVSLFDCAWYGVHDVTGDMLVRFRSNLDRIRAC